MQTSSSIDKISAALAKAQAMVKPALKDSRNPDFDSKYADLSSVWEACRAARDANDLAVVQWPISTDAGVGVETVLLHASGQWMSHEFVLPVVKADAQGGGSCITYARRYAVAAIFGVCPEDDDGNAAAASVANTKPAKGAHSAALVAKHLPGLTAAAKQGPEALSLYWKALSMPAKEALESEKNRLKAELAKEPAHAAN